MADNDRQGRQDYLAEDAADARHALAMATQLAASITHRDDPWQNGKKLEAISDDWTAFADAAYAWLRNRVSLRPARLIITPGTPQSESPEGAAMTTPTPGTLSLTDTQGDTMTVSAVDAAGFSTPDAGPFTWSLASGGNAVATVTDNGDGTASIKAAAPGDDTVNCSDANGLTASLPVTVTAGPAASLEITAGTPA